MLHSLYLKICKYKYYYINRFRIVSNKCILSLISVDLIDFELLLGKKKKKKLLQSGDAIKDRKMNLRLEIQKFRSM